MDLLLALSVLALVTVAYLASRRLNAVHTRPGPTTHSRLRRLWSVLREFYATQPELVERQALLNRRWKEDFLHWAHDGQSWQPHGHLVPPPNSSHCSNTREGWRPATHRSALIRAAR